MPKLPRLRPLLALSLSAVLAALTGCVSGGDPSRAGNAALREALLLHASFDGGVNADYAAGDATFYTAPTGELLIGICFLDAPRFIEVRV